MRRRLASLSLALLAMSLASMCSTATSCTDCTRCHCKCFDSFFSYIECKKISINPSTIECAGSSTCCGLNRNIQAECIRTKSYVGLIIGVACGIVGLIIVIVVVCKFCNRNKVPLPVQSMGYQPGVMQPGMMQPGVMQPGMMQSGLYMPQQGLYNQPPQIMYGQQPNQIYGQPAPNQFATAGPPIF